MTTSTPVPHPGARALLLWALGRLQRFQVRGASMTPALEDGDTVLIDPRARPAPGAVVVARHPYRSDVTVVKRVAAITGAGKLHLSGDNPAESTDSAHYGAVPTERLLGVVVAKLPR